MPIVQISRIQHRRGKETDLPQLAAGELGWVVDSQKLYIGNGTLADGAPNLGNTEVVTTGSSAFGTTLKYLYQGYLDSPGISGYTTQRTLQSKLDEQISVKDFGATGDGTTNDLTAINDAMEYVYRHTDKTDTNSHRILFFPAGTYKVIGSVLIPPYAHLRGEGPGKSVIFQTGGADPESKIVAKTVDNSGNIHGSQVSITSTQIEIEGICFTNGEAYAGLSIDDATNVYIRNCKFQGTYTSGGADAVTSTGVTVRSTNALTCSNIVFDQCQFTKYARLVDLSYDVDSVRFRDCDFSISYYGARLGQTTDGSSAGLIVGPRNIQFLNSRWSTIGQNAISVFGNGSITNIVSFGNWYSKTVGNNFEGVGTFSEVPIVDFNADECESIADYFERTDLRRVDGSSNLNAAPEVQGIGRQTKAVKQITLTNNTSPATTTTLEFPAGSTSLGKSIVLNYKIERGTDFRVGRFLMCASTSSVTYDDDYNESNSDLGITLSAAIGKADSTDADKTVVVKYTTSNTGSNATMDVEVEQLV